MAINKMDWQKNLLVAAILAVLLMLFIRWHQFQDQQAQQLPAAVASQSATSEIPTVETSESSDVPSATLATAELSESAKNQLATNNLISVKTDTFEVTINPLGGDIVRLALPQHSEELDTPEKPFVLLNTENKHTYIAQSGLIGKNGTDDQGTGRPLFQVSQTNYVLKEGENSLVVDLTLDQGTSKITKRFTFNRGDYLISIEYLIDNQSDTPWSAQIYGQIKRDSQNFTKVSGMQMNPYLGAAINTKETNYKKVTFKDVEEKDFTEIKEGGWVAMVQHYFISAWIPDANLVNHYRLRKQENADLYFFGFASDPVTIEPGTQGQLKASFYAGPKDTERLEEISPNLDLTVDYGWLWWIAKPLFGAMKYIHGVVGNWGLAIIGLTLLVKALFFYPSAISYRSMAKMRKLQPKMAELKERHGEDRQKFSQEMMKLYKTEKVNPFGGCLPMLIQMPVFLALYWVLAESVELRHAPFFGWIHDLSIKDPYFVLPLIYGATMWVMQKLNPQPADPMQARVMQMLPLVFTFMFLFFPAGLVLYWVTNNSLSIVQQYIITKNIENEDVKA